MIDNTRRSKSMFYRKHFYKCANPFQMLDIFKDDEDIVKYCEAKISEAPGYIVDMWFRFRENKKAGTFERVTLKD